MMTDKISTTKKSIAVAYLVMILMMMTIDKIEISYLLLSIVGIVYLSYCVKGRFIKEKMIALFLAGRVILFVHDIIYKFSGSEIHAFVAREDVSFGIYAFVSLCSLASLSVYFYHLTKKWNRFRLLLDITYFLFVVAYLFNAVVFKELIIGSYQLITSISIYVIFISDALMAMMLLIIVFSDISIRQSFFKQMFAFGYASLLMADVTFFIDYYYNLSDKLTSIGNIFLGITILGLVYAVDVLKDDKLKALSSAQNLQMAAERYTIWYVLIVPIVLNLLNLKNFLQISIFLIITLSYFSINSIHRQISMSYQLSDEENQLKRKVAEFLEAKNRDLQVANAVLIEESNTDHLTGLKNRTFFFDYVRELMSGADVHFSILYVDLDHFKEINDLHGHHVGDEVLIEVARRFRGRELTDLVVSRIGGDEFAVVYPEANRDQLISASNRILRSLSQSIYVKGLSFKVGASIGIACYPTDATSLEQLLNYADVAMYHAKRSDREKVCVYSESLLENIEEKNRIKLFLHNLDVDRDFQLCFKPILRSREMTPYACKVSFSWDCASSLTCELAEFDIIAMADVELLGRMMMWLIKNTIEQLNDWQRAGGLRVKAMIDLPIRLLMQDVFMSSLRDYISQSGVDSTRLLFRMSEHSANVLFGYANDSVAIIKSLGCGIVLDDFGTGYVSLAKVGEYDVKMIVVEQSLIDAMVDDEKTCRLVKSIILMAHGLNVKVMAKGITSMDQLETLRKFSCDCVQVDISNEALTTEQFEGQFLYMSKRGVS